MRFFQALIWLTGAIACFAETPPKDWGLSTSLGNSVGIGTFVAGYSQTPSWSTSLSINPSYQIPQFWGLPRIGLSANEMISVWWLDSYGTSVANAQNRVLLSDLSLNAAMPRVLNSEETGFSLGVNMGTSIPVSIFSRNINRIIGFTGSLPVGWSKWGFNAGFTPSVSGWVYSDSHITAPCWEMSPATINPYDVNTDISQAIQGLTMIKNGDERFGDGRCLVSGRQNTWSINNAFSLGWSNKNHGVNASLTWMINFLRPLSDRPDLRSENARAQNFTETTMGRIAYSYTLPIETSLVLSAGILSWQSVLDSEGHLTFPFFDFRTPGNNQTQIFVQATVGI